MTHSIFRLLTVGMLVGLFSLSGCTTFKRNVGDNSLDYTKNTKLDPIVLPANTQTAPFTPLYNVPQTGENTLKIKADKGKRFELPPPIHTVK